MFKYKYFTIVSVIIGIFAANASYAALYDPSGRPSTSGLRSSNISKIETDLNACWEPFMKVLGERKNNGFENSLVTSWRLISPWHGGKMIGVPFDPSSGDPEPRYIG